MRGVEGRLLRQRRPELARLWIRYAPRRWPAPAAPWFDLFTSSPGDLAGAPEDLHALADTPVDDLLYLPPVEAGLRAARNEIAALHAARGTPVLVQVVPGETAPPPPVLAVLDLLPLALGEIGLELSTGATAAVWALLPGVGGEPAAWTAMTARLAAHGVAAVQGVAAEAEPRQLRRLAALVDEDRALALFHASPPPLSAFASAVTRGGLAPFVARALPRPPLHGADNLHLAALLAEAGELCALLGEPASRREAFRRAARWAEESRPSLVALAREGNLEVLDWLEEEPRRLVAESDGGATPATLLALRGRLAAPAAREEVR